MSGMKNLANALANDPSFSAGGFLSRSEAKQIVSAEDPKMPTGIRSASAPSVSKRRTSSSYMR